MTKIGSFDIRRIGGSRDVSIGETEFELLENKSIELDIDPSEILNWLIEEFIDEYTG